MAEKIIGGVVSGHLARGLVRGYGLYVTSDRIIGVKGGWRQILGGTLMDASSIFAEAPRIRAGVQTARGATRKARQLIERKTDFEVRRDELEGVRLRRSHGPWRILWWGAVDVRAAGRTYTIRIGRGGEEIREFRKMFTAFEPDKFVFED